MGIINVTPDSFYKGSRNYSVESALKQAEKHLSDGADFLDIGGYSSRPGANNISTNEELKRVIEPIIAIKLRFPNALISIDTFRAKVAQEAVEAGADLVNDISAGDDDANMFMTIKTLQVPYIIMHKQGSPENMQRQPKYENVLLEVAQYLSEKVLALNNLGINDIIVDPGFGFGKNNEHNYQLLKHLDHLSILETPILVGFSRKSMINKVLDTTPANALNGTTILNTLALQKGAHILRVHDSKEAVEIGKLIQTLNQA